jgi:hypothetical protein
MPLLSSERPAQALYGLILVGALLVLVALTGSIHAYRYGAHWHERIPPVWLSRLDTHQWDAKLYQLVIVILLVIVPLASLYKFHDTLSRAHLCLLGSTDDGLFADKWKSGFPGSTKQVRLVTELKQKQPGTGVPECTGGVEVFPPTEFIIIFILDWLAVAAALLFIGLVFVGGRGRNAKA